MLNKISRSIIRATWKALFPYKSRRIGKIHTTAWKTAWRKAGLPIDGSFKKGPHNLKHTFGRRSRAVGVPLETRKLLLPHTNEDINSSAELEELIDAVELIAGKNSRKSPTVTLIHKKSSRPSRLTA